MLTDNSTTLACDYEITTDSKSATELKADISNKTSDTSFLDAVSQSLESELQSQGITVDVTVAISSVGVATTAAPSPLPSEEPQGPADRLEEASLPGLEEDSATTTQVLSGAVLLSLVSI